MFETDNCTDTPYTNHHQTHQDFILTHNDENDLPHHYTIPYVSEHMFYESIKTYGQSCDTLPGQDYDVRPMTEIFLPFSYPIPLPLKFEMTELE